MITHPRWGDSGMDPRPAGGVSRYASTTSGPVRRLPILDGPDRVLGYVWTDDSEAAGWVEVDATSTSTQEGRARVRAASLVWQSLFAAYARGVPAAEVFDNLNIETVYRYGPVETTERPFA